MPKHDIIYPDDGIIPDEQRKIIENHYNSKVKKPFECVVCKETKWSFLPQYIQMPVYINPLTYPDKIEMYLGVAMLCNNCSNTHIFNAEKIMSQYANSGDADE